MGKSRHGKRKWGDWVNSRDISPKCLHRHGQSVVTDGKDSVLAGTNHREKVRRYMNR